MPQNIFDDKSRWVGAIRQQAITWANVDQDLCCHMATLGLIELKLQLHLRLSTNGYGLWHVQHLSFI